MWFLRLGRSFSCFRVCRLGGDEVGPFSRGKMGIFDSNKVIQQQSHTSLASLPNNSRKKKQHSSKKLYFCCLRQTVQSQSGFRYFSLSLFGIPSRKRGLLETQRTFFDFPWVNKIKQSSSFFQHSFLH